MPAKMLDHTLNERSVSASVQDPDTAIAWLMADRGLTWAGRPDKALVTELSVKTFRGSKDESAGSWEIKATAVFEGTVQQYTVFVKVD